jgi:hypothetical protein
VSPSNTSFLFLLRFWCDVDGRSRLGFLTGCPRSSLFGFGLLRRLRSCPLSLPFQERREGRLVSADFSSEALERDLTDELPADFGRVRAAVELKYGILKVLLRHNNGFKRNLRAKERLQQDLLHNLR